MSELDRAWTTLAVGSTTVKVHLEDEAARHVFDVAFAALVSEDQPEHEAAITTCELGYKLEVDGEQVYQGSDVANVIDLLVSWCNREAIESRSEVVNLHAAGIVAPASDRAIVIPAAPGSGKTTTAAIACAAGWGYLSDEMISVDTDGMLWGYPKPLTFKAGTKDLFDGFDYDRWTLSDRQTRWYVPASDLGGHVVETAAAHALVFVAYEPDRATTASEIGSAVAALELVTNCQDLLDEDGVALMALATLASSVRSYTLEQPDISASLEALAEIAQAQPTEPTPVVPLSRPEPGSVAVGPCIGDDVVGVAMSDGVLIHRPSTRAIALLDPIAGLIWQLLDGSTSEEGLVTELAEAFDHPLAEVRVDVGALLDQLGSNGFLRNSSTATD